MRLPDREQPCLWKGLQLVVAPGWFLLAPHLLSVHCTLQCTTLHLQAAAQCPWVHRWYYKNGCGVPASAARLAVLQPNRESSPTSALSHCRTRYPVRQGHFCTAERGINSDKRLRSVITGGDRLCKVSVCVGTPLAMLTRVGRGRGQELRLEAGAAEQ